MVKHTQTIRRQKPTNCLRTSDYFVGLVLKGLTTFGNLFEVFPKLLFPAVLNVRNKLSFYKTK